MIYKKKLIELLCVSLLVSIYSSGSFLRRVLSSLVVKNKSQKYIIEYYLRSHHKSYNFF